MSDVRQWYRIGDLFQQFEVAAELEKQVLACGIAHDHVKVQRAGPRDEEQRGTMFSVKVRLGIEVTFSGPNAVKAEYVREVA